MGRLMQLDFSGHHEAGKNLEGNKNPRKIIKGHAHTRQSVL